MSAHFEYDDSKLQAMWRELEPKRRRQAIRGALMREAVRVRNIARGIVAGQLRHGRELAKGVRSAVYKRNAVGFKVTVAPKKSNKKWTDEKKHQRDARKRSMHINSRNLEKPILLWASLGTKQRKTRGRFSLCGYSRGRNTGAMKMYDFMKRTNAQVTGTVRSNLSKALVESVTKIAHKYGAK